MAASPNDYVTVAEIKAGMPDTDWGNSYDAFLKILATGVGRLLDRHLGLDPGSLLVDTDETRYYDGTGTSRQWIDPIAAVPTTVSMDLTGDQVTYTVISSSDYEMWPKNALQLGEPFYRMDMKLLANPTYYLWYSYPNSIKVTGKFGFYTEVPGYVKQVATMQAIRWFKRAQQGFQDVGAIRELGQLQYVKGIDPDLQNFLDVTPGRIAI